MATSAVALTTAATVTATLATSPTTPTTRPPLPCYNGRRIDNSDLFEAIDHADHKLFETFDLVNSISGQTTWLTPSDCCGSSWSTRVITHERLGTGLTIIVTLERRTI